MIDAATLLSHALPDAISWNGTKGGALGFDVDRALVAEITKATSIPASTSALALLDALEVLSAKRVALITPYDDAYQAKCVMGFSGQGIQTVSERHSGLVDNFSYGLVPAEEIAAMTRAAVAETRPDAVVFFCTNFFGAEIAPALELELDLPVLDSTALGVWGALRAAGRDPIVLARWGRIFATPSIEIHSGQRDFDCPRRTLPVSSSLHPRWHCFTKARCSSQHKGTRVRSWLRWIWRRDRVARGPPQSPEGITNPTARQKKQQRV